MADVATYESLATYNGTGSSTQITFSSIDQTYTDLVLVVSNIDIQIDNMGLRFNSDSGTNYSRTRMIGDGTSFPPPTARNTNQSYLYFGYKDDAVSTKPVNHVLQIQNYSNSNKYKTCLNRYTTVSGGNYNVMYEVAMWRSTSAINQIDIFSGNANFSTNCMFTLYGIKAN